MSEDLLVLKTEPIAIASDVSYPAGYRLSGKIVTDDPEKICDLTKRALIPNGLKTPFYESIPREIFARTRPPELGEWYAVGEIEAVFNDNLGRDAGLVLQKIVKTALDMFFSVEMDTMTEKLLNDWGGIRSTVKHKRDWRRSND